MNSLFKEAPPKGGIQKGTRLETGPAKQGTLRKIDASKLPATILNSHANSTVTKYLCAFQRWKTWAGSKGLETVPAKPDFFAL